MGRNLAAAAAVFIFASVDGTAADPYRWCAQDMGQSGASNCYFLTLEQCKATASGAGSFCSPNTFYTGPDSPSRPRTKRR